MKFAVLGSGSWGTALAAVLSNKGYDTVLWGRNAETMNEMANEHVNMRYLPNITLPKTLKYTADIDKALDGADIVVYTVPTQSFRDVLSKTTASLKQGQIIVNVAKGIEITTSKTLSAIAEELAPQCTYVVLSGPSHAEEVVKFMPTTLVSASCSKAAAMLIQEVFSTEYLRVYSHPDVRGAEIGGALKNIIAIGAGISDGLGYGDNAKAALMTRGIKEIASFGECIGADMSTFQGLTGIGDLIVTCTSTHSRNWRCGNLIGKGASLEEAKASIGMVVEGAFTIKAVHLQAQALGVEMPITAELYRVLYEGKSAKEAVRNLMLRNKKHELEDFHHNHSTWRC